jgi:adenosine deaminase
MRTRDFIQALPKAELHLHFEGMVPWHLVQAHSEEPLPDTPPWWADDFRFDDFQDFTLAMKDCYGPVLTSVEHYQQVAQIAFDNLAAQNVRYVETSVAPNIALEQGLSLVDVIAAIKVVAPPTLTVAVFCGLARHNCHTLNDPIIQAVFSAPNLDGIDLHGDERLGDPAPFAEIFARARHLGLMTKAHAGELTGPQTIRDTLDLLQVTRIEHGTTAIEDEALLACLADEGITLDMCPTSNLKLRVVDSLENHPIRDFLRRGIPVTVNTDDPTVFGSSLTNELYLLAERLDFSPADLAQVQIAAFNVARLSDLQRAEVLAEIDQLVAETVFSIR